MPVDKSHIPTPDTNLGWAIVGVTHVEEVNDDILMSYFHRIVTREVPCELQGDDDSKEPITQVIFSHKMKTKELLTPQSVQQILEVDFKGSGQDGISLSFNDAKFLDILAQGIN